MTACNRLSILAIGLVVIGWGTRVYAEGDVTVVTPPSSPPAPPVAVTSPDGSPPLHIESHKKKKRSAVASSATATQGTGTTSVATTPSSAGASQAASPPPAHITPKIAPAPIVTPKPVVAAMVPPDPPADPAPAPAISPATTTGGLAASLGPAVETVFPIAAHHASTDDPDYSAPSASYRTTLASTLPPLQAVTSVLPVTPPDANPGTDSSAGGSPGIDDSYPPDEGEKRTRTYPWKSNIITTEFWIGEPGSSISSTANVDSAWVEDWRSSNHGSDDPNDRQGYLPASHAPTVNPFYVALPFNDLAYPDQARRWLPEGWQRRSRDGKQVSACKDRWVEIKNQQGDVCYAQWEDVGPLTSDHPEYVFGDERPDTLTRAGLDVSPAVAKFLGIEPEGRNRLTSWRFVDAENVPPGYWLKYDEESIIFSAMHDLNNKHLPEMDDDSSIQHSIAPTNDPSQINTNKKKLGEDKG